MRNYRFFLQVGTRNNTGVINSNQPNPSDQSTLTTITTDDGSSGTLVPDSPPPPPHPAPALLPPSSSSPGHSAIASCRPVDVVHVPDLTITDLHTTTMSSVGELGVTEPIDPHKIHTAAVNVAHSSSSEDSDSSSDSSANTETPPPEIRRSTASQSLHIHTRKPQAFSKSSRSTAAGAAQKVRFSHSTEREQREMARRGGSSLTTDSSVGKSGIEVGDISSTQLKLGLDAQVAQSRASVLATLYQNYLREMNTAQPVTKETPKVTSRSKKTGTTTKPKLKSYPRPTSKVHSCIFCALPIVHVI